MTSSSSLPSKLDQTKETRIILSLMRLNPDSILFYRNKTKGWIHKRIIQTDSISTYFVSQRTENEPLRRIVLSHISDVIVVNAHSVNQNTFRGFSTGTRYLRNYYGMGHSSGRTVGDMMFLGLDGQSKILFKEMPDPRGVRMIAIAERKRLLVAIKDFDKEQNKGMAK